MFPMEISTGQCELVFYLSKILENPKNFYHIYAYDFEEGLGLLRLGFRMMP